MFDAPLARERAFGAEHDLDAGVLRHHLAIALGEVAERRRAARAEDHRDLTFAADVLGGPLGDLGADPLFVDRDVERLIGRRGASRERDDRDFRLGGRVVGGVHADRVDRRDQHAFDPARDQILNAVDLFELVLVGGDRDDIPAEFLGAGANAAQHQDVERVVVLGERHADGHLSLAERGRRQNGGRGEDGKNGNSGAA